MQEILYVSALSTERLVNDIYIKTGENPGFAVQKFSRLLVKGFAANGVRTQTLSNAPIPSSYMRKLVERIIDENEYGVSYRYIPYIKIPFIKHLFILVYSFAYVIIWGRKNKANKVVICDVLNISVSIGALLASKCCGLKSVAVVTDIYDQMVGKSAGGIRRMMKWTAGKLNKIYVRSFSSYVLLTEDMNMLVNPKERPHIVMEGLCDLNASTPLADSHKDHPRVVIYAGGLEERYGVKMLVDAFKTLDVPDVELHLYGSGSYVEELSEDVKQDSRIKYLGVRANHEIVQAERRATLLVNPRFTNEDFVKYSFPSKNMEYMASGTPLLTTKLPGMPAEYYDYVFLFEQESISGYAESLSHILNMDSEYLMQFGAEAQKFVLESKNNVAQSLRIIKFLGLKIV